LESKYGKIYLEYKNKTWFWFMFCPSGKACEIWAGQTNRFMWRKFLACFWKEQGLVSVNNAAADAIVTICGSDSGQLHLIRILISIISAHSRYQY
jgi:hypothetical protein